MPDASETTVARLDLRFEHAAGLAAKQHVGVTDNTLANPCRAITTACGLGGDAIGKLHFAHRAHGFRPAGAIHRTAIDIHGRNDVVARSDVIGDFVQHVGLSDQVPEVVVRVDNRARRIEDVFLMQS